MVVVVVLSRWKQLVALSKDHGAVEEYVAQRKQLQPLLQECFAYLEEEALDLPNLFSKRVDASTTASAV